MKRCKGIVQCEALAKRMLLSAVIDVPSFTRVDGTTGALQGSPGTVIHVHSGDVDGSSASLDILSTRYQWDFGDVVGGVQGTFNQLEGFNAAHAYDREGTFILTLTQTAPDGTQKGDIPA